MSLTREKNYTGKNIRVGSGLFETDAEVWYDPNSGTVQLRKVNGGKLLYDSVDASINFIWLNRKKVEDSIKNDEELTEILKEGIKPGFLTEGGEKGREDEIRTSAIEKTFETTDKDKYFLDQGMAAQYPIDAIYGNSIADENSQDHLVISQYRYKSPRAGEIWGGK